MIRHHLWFKTDKFEIVPGEDDETNPLCFGKQLAEWLRIKLISCGYEVEPVIPEDWGWCVMCSRKPFMLFVGCVSMHDYAVSKPSDPIPKGNDVVWTCTVFAEQSLLGRIFKRIDTAEAVEKLFSQIHIALSSEPDITFIDEP